MKISKHLSFLFGLFFLLSCEKQDVENLQTLNILFLAYENGEIDKCVYDGEVVFCAGLNAYDAGTAIYDKGGNLIGNCNYAWDIPDSMCYKLKSCETIYRVKNNIWGLPEINKYKLGK